MKNLLRVVASLFLFVSLNSFSSVEFYFDKNYFFENYGDYISKEENFNDLVTPYFGEPGDILFDGFSIKSSDESGLFADQPNFAGASSKILFAGNTGYIEIQFESSFNILGMDIAELFTGPSPGKVSVEDIYGNKSTISYADVGWGDSPSFVGVFTINPLSSLSFEAYEGDGDYESIDNLAIGSYGSPIPVPAAAWLFGSALAGVCVARRKK